MNTKLAKLKRLKKGNIILVKDLVPLSYNISSLLSLFFHISLFQWQYLPLLFILN